MENGERRARLSILTPNANILRLKDAIHPEHANTPVSRTCYTCQLILAGEVDITMAHRQLIREVEILSQVFSDRDSRSIISRASKAISTGNYYQTLKQLRDLLPREARLLAAQES